MVFLFSPHLQKNEPNHCPSTFLIRLKNKETVIWFFFREWAKKEIASEILPPLTWGLKNVGKKSVKRKKESKRNKRNKRKQA